MGSTTMSSSASIATARSATPPTPLTSSPSRRRSARRTSSRTVSSTTGRLPLRKRSSSATLHLSVTARAQWNAELSMSPSAPPGTTSMTSKCEDVTQGYTTEKKCTKWPKQVCKSEKKNVKKYSPETECKKVPKELCGPSGCELK